ncbi:hypothetical protein H2203_000145 [Taxawa tesnikishii (nom. ined.)]|nr:hypothetical protein H2203_000145 [Dothideales sp. JES 119]
MQSSSRSRPRAQPFQSHASAFTAASRQAQQSRTTNSLPPQQSYSLAGHPQSQHATHPGARPTFVAEGYRQLNPEYERQVHDPTFSLGGNLPHTVRGFMARKDRNGKEWRQPVQEAVGETEGPEATETEEKGETEIPPQLENAEEWRDEETEQQAGTYQSMYWSWGFAAMLGIYISGGSSGGHLNPALSLMLCFYRGFPLRRVPSYVFFQILGAFCGALLAFAVYRDDILHLDAFFTEFLATAVLSGSILALGDDSNSPPGAGMHAFIIGLLVTTLLMSVGYNTTGCFNPARDLGPRLAALAVGYPTSIFNVSSAWWIWGGWGATISGALVGAGVYDACVFKGGESPVNYSTRKWEVEGRKTEISWLKAFGKKGKAGGLEGKLEKGEI